MMVIKFAYVGEFTSKRRRVGVGEFARRRVDRIPNLKMVGVAQINENESAEDTANLCVKLFSSLGNDISASDIDIAHRV